MNVFFYNFLQVLGTSECYSCDIFVMTKSHTNFLPFTGQGMLLVGHLGFFVCTTSEGLTAHICRLRVEIISDICFNKNC